MASAREMRLRIKSVKNISQVTRALETVSASKVRKAVNAVMATRSYATKAWQVLRHVAEQPGRDSLHPLLVKRPNVKNALVVVVTGDRGLAGAYNSNVIRFTAQKFDQYSVPVKYIAELYYAKLYNPSAIIHGFGDPNQLHPIEGQYFIQRLYAVHGVFIRAVQVVIQHNHIGLV